MSVTANLHRIAALAEIGVVFLLAGCAGGKNEAQQECFYRMMLLSAGGVSYMLENKLPGTNVVTADALVPYLKPGTEWAICPTTRAKYANFNLDDGPECRVHGKAYQSYNSALVAKDHPCRAHALKFLGYSPKDPWNDQHSTALVDSLITVLKEEQGKAKDAAGATLQRITGQNLGVDSGAWQAWWKTNRETFQFKP